MSDELEELAAKGRDAQARKQAAARKKADRARRRAQTSESKVLQTSLSGGSSWWLVGCMMLGSFATIGLAFSISLGLAGLVDSRVGLACTALTLFGGIGGMTAMTLLLFRWRRKEAERWLRRLPFAFDIDGYYQVLSGKRMRTDATVKVFFVEAPDDAAREVITAAVRGAADVKHANFAKKGRVLVVKSPGLDTYVMTKAERPNFYSNATVHQWFRQLADKGLAVIHRKHPFERVEISAK